MKLRPVLVFINYPIFNACLPINYRQINLVINLIKIIHMKKIIILVAIFIMGVGSLSAQNEYEVLVTWNYATPFYCQSELSSNNVFVVTLNIYDVVNGVEIADTYHIVSWNATSTTFYDYETDVEAWCDQAPKAPNFRVEVVVSMVNTSTHDVYCDEGDIVYKTCEEFSSGILKQFLFY